MHRTSSTDVSLLDMAGACYSVCVFCIIAIVIDGPKCHLDVIWMSSGCHLDVIFCSRYPGPWIRETKEGVPLATRLPTFGVRVNRSVPITDSSKGSKGHTGRGYSAG